MSLAAQPPIRKRAAIRLCHSNLQVAQIYDRYKRVFNSKTFSNSNLRDLRAHCKDLCLHTVMQTLLSANQSGCTILVIYKTF